MKIEDQIENDETKLADVPAGMCFSFIPKQGLYIKAGPNNATINAFNLADGGAIWFPPHEPVITFPNATVVLKD